LDAYNSLLALVSASKYSLHEKVCLVLNLQQERAAAVGRGNRFETLPFQAGDYFAKMTFQLWSLLLPYGSPKSRTVLWPTLEGLYMERD